MRAFVFQVWPYVAAVIFFTGLAWSVYRWFTAPNPLKIALTPARPGPWGAARRLGADFWPVRPLFLSRPDLAVVALAFHLALALVLVRHLAALVVAPASVAGWWLHVLGVGAGYALVPLLSYLVIRRMVLETMIFISSLADYAILLLLIVVAVTGVWMHLTGRPDPAAVKQWAAGLTRLRPGIVSGPGSAVFLIHFLGATVLLAVFPFTKMQHALGFLFSPTRRQRHDPRERRWFNPWDKDFAADRLVGERTEAGPDAGRGWWTLERYRQHLTRRMAFGDGDESAPTDGAPRRPE